MDWNLRPARDLGLPPGERLRSLGRERGLVGTLTGGLWRRAVRLYLGAAHGLAVTGRANLPPPPFVMVANHASHLDALALGAALRGDAARNAHALAAGELFFGGPARAVLAAYAINALPVWRGRTRREDLLTLRRRLAEDALVMILFPEGTRSRDGRMAPFKAGLGPLVAGTAVPVVPCFLDGAHRAWPPDRRWPRPGAVRLRIGAPIRFDDVPDDRAGWDRVARACEAAVRALAPGGPDATGAGADGTASPPPR